MCWVYRRNYQGSGSYIFTVGYWTLSSDDTGGTFGSDWNALGGEFEREVDAMKRVNFLNGGSTSEVI